MIKYREPLILGNGSVFHPYFTPRSLAVDYIKLELLHSSSGTRHFPVSGGLERQSPEHCWTGLIGETTVWADWGLVRAYVYGVHFFKNILLYM